MHAVLQRVVSQIADEVAGLDTESAQRHPGGLDYKWNAQQVVEHLVLGYRVTSAALQARLAKGRPPRKQDRTYLQWSLQLMILSLGALPQGVPALEETVPGAGQFAPMNGRRMGDFLSQEIEAMDLLLDSCRRKFGMERVATHPWLGPLRVDQWRRFHVIHGYHHLAQVRSVIAEVAPEAAPLRAAGQNLVEKLQIPAQRPLA